MAKTKANMQLEPRPETHGLQLNWLAPVYDRVCSTFGLGLAFRETTLRYADLKPGERVLDVGCGTGVLTRLAAKVVGEKGQVVGIDPATKIISIAKENAALKKNHAGFRVATIENLPFEDNSFDCVLSSLMLHRLPPDIKLKGPGLTLLAPRRIMMKEGWIPLPSIPCLYSQAWNLLYRFTHHA